MKRVPSLSTIYSERPGFPKGLRVLLLDGDAKSRSEVEAQLIEAGYVPTACKTCAEAAAHLSNSDYGFDVVLADCRAVMQKVAGAAAVVASSKRLPLVLMSASSSPNDVMHSIRLGAQECLPKPLATTKVKAIWQHVVRRLMKASSGEDPPKPPLKGSRGARGAAANKHQSSSAAASGNGESGSNSSSSEQHGKGAVPVEELGLEAAVLLGDGDDMFDLDPLAFADLADVDADVDADSPLAHLADGFSHLLMGDTEANMGLPLAGPGPSSVAAAEDFGFVFPVFNMGAPGEKPARVPTGRASTGRRSRDLPRHASAPALRPRRASSGSMAGPGPGPDDPVIGHSAGQLPPLPDDVPGIAWGLPTNPLQIMPKVGPMGPPMMPPMPWGMPSGMMPPGAMGPMGMFQPPHSMMGASMPCMSQLAAASTSVGSGMDKQQQQQQLYQQQQQLQQQQLQQQQLQEPSLMMRVASAPLCSTALQPLDDEALQAALGDAPLAPLAQLGGPSAVTLGMHAAGGGLPGLDEEPHSLLERPGSPSDLIMGMMDMEALDLLEGFGLGMPGGADGIDGSGCDNSDGGDGQPQLPPAVGSCTTSPEQQQQQQQGLEQDMVVAVAAPVAQRPMPVGFGEEPGVRAVSLSPKEEADRLGPLKLQLRKTPSLLDMIQHSIRLPS